MTPWIVFGIGLSVGIGLSFVSLAICEVISRKQAKDESFCAYKNPDTREGWDE